MRRLFTAISTSPMSLLAGCGFVFAIKIMIAKAALSAGVLPFQLGFLGNLGAGLVILVLIVHSGELIPTSRIHIFLYIALGIISFAAPTVLSYGVVDHVGPAYTSTVYSLSPILTMSFAAGLGIEKMNVQRFLGIIIGLVGMLTLVQQQFALINTDETEWVMLGLLIPAFAAIGNVIRSKFWPKGTSPRAFACATLLTSSALVLIMAPVFENLNDWQFSQPVLLGWVALMATTSAVSYVLNFQLQNVAGPVVFSQIGYWGTGFGVVLAALMFGDVLTIISIAGLLTIIGGGIIAKC